MYNGSIYILSGLFVRNLKKNQFDAIIFETKETPNFEKKHHHNILSLYDMGLDFSPKGKLVQYINKNTSTLLILDKLNIDILKDALLNIKTNLTIINCNIGISSIGKKLQVEKSDIMFFEQQNCKLSNLFEPFDIESIHYLLEKKMPGITYIRIANKDYAQNILQKNDQNSKKKLGKKRIIEKPSCFHCKKEDTKKEIPPIIDLTTTNSTTTKPVISIACGGSILPTTIQACAILEDKKIPTDVFVLFDWQVVKSNKKKSTIYYKNLLEHVSMTKKLVIICDHEENEKLKTIRNRFLKQHDVRSDIFFITPETKNISTTLEDYIYEQAQFDGNAIAQKIEKFLNQNMF